MKNTILTLVTASILTGCMTTATLAPELRPQYWGTAIDTTHNFYKISDVVYRSEQPDHTLSPLLREHNIDTVITLRAKDKSKHPLIGSEFNVIDVPIHTWAIDRDDLLEVMRHIQTAQQHNKKVLLHCYHGSDRTGANVAMYRIIFQNWTIDEAVREMKHGGYGFHAIWFNIEKLFTVENVAWIKTELAKPY